MLSVIGPIDNRFLMIEFLTNIGCSARFLKILFSTVDNFLRVRGNAAQKAGEPKVNIGRKNAL